MGLYESNFIRLGWLAGEPGGACAARHRSAVPADCDLVLTVTRALALHQYRWRSPTCCPMRAGPCRYPDMRVRVYHDAHLVEAQQWAARSQLSRCCAALRNRAERELDQRWARNMMLNKWLEYCVERGHRFSSRTRLSAGA